MIIIKNNCPVHANKMTDQPDEIKLTNKKSTVRLEGLDTIRGITILSMIIYHACWDLIFLFGKNIPGYTGMGGYLWQRSICWSFILLSGFCWSMGHHHVKRGLVVLGAGFLITGATVWIMPESRVIFGVLTMMGSCMLILIPMENYLLRLSEAAGLVGSFLLFFLFKNLNRGYLGISKELGIKLPDGLYRNLFTAYLGFPPEGFYSTDYFSMIPWMFLFLAGFYIYRILIKKELVNRLFSWRIPFFDIIGKNSLLIYLLHQPIIYGVLVLML